MYIIENTSAVDSPVSHPASSLLIAFSGLDGAGKTTQINLARKHFSASGSRVRYFWSRGGYTPGIECIRNFIRRLLGSSIPAPGPNARRTVAFKRSWIRQFWLMAAILDLLVWYGVCLRWWRWRRQVVICDRFLWDTLVDWRVHFADEQVERWFLWRILESVTPRPDAAFFLAIPIPESVVRSTLKNDPFAPPADIREKQAAEYRALAKRGYWHILDGRSAIPDLATEILCVIRRKSAGPLGAAGQG